LALLVFKTSVGLETVPGGFDSHPPPPCSTESCVLVGNLDNPPMHRPRIPQPPIAPLKRDTEDRDFWPAFAVALAAVFLLYAGTNHRTSLMTQDGDSASAMELIRSFATGGLHFEVPSLTLDPALIDDPMQAAVAMDHAAAQADLPLRARYRVNTGTADPCPT
jgi:hypothetical protein